jgi:hypothetical protein
LVRAAEGVWTGFRNSARGSTRGVLVSPAGFGLPSSFCLLISGSD